MIINIFTLLLEIIYCFLPLQQFVNSKKKLFLLVGIVLCIMFSGAIFEGIIFRYFMLPILMYSIVKILNKDNRISLFIIITILLFFKLLLEFIFVFLLDNYISFNFIVIIFEIISFICSLMFTKYVKVLNEKILKLWNGIHEFYFRYLFLMTYNTFILFCIYNLIKMKEVL